MPRTLSMTGNLDEEAGAGRGRRRCEEGAATECALIEERREDIWEALSEVFLEAELSGHAG